MTQVYHILNIICYLVYASGRDILSKENETDATYNELTRLYTDHRSFCRISDSCNSTVWDWDLYCHCERCSCKPECFETDSCCPETITDIWNIQKPEVQQKCISFSYKGFDSEFRQTMMADCPSSFETSDENKEITNKCERRHESSYLGDILPVDDKTTDITYANEFCAKCHSIPSTNLKHEWSAILKCNTSLFTPKSFDTILADINQTDCDIVLTPKVRRYQKSCYNVISSCNVTKEWKSYDSFTEQACLAYKSTYMKRFRNPFCAICNGYEVERYKRAATHCGIHIPPIPSFSALLNFRPEYKAVKVNSDGECREDQIFDTVTNVCRDLQCEFGKRLRNGTCERVFSQSHGLCYRIYIQLTPVIITCPEENNTLVVRSERNTDNPNPEGVAIAFQNDITEVVKEYDMLKKMKNITFYKIKNSEDQDSSDSIFASMFFSLTISLMDDGGFINDIKKRYHNSYITLPVGNKDNASGNTFRADLVRLQFSPIEETITSPKTGVDILPFYSEYTNRFLKVSCAEQKVITVTDFNFHPFVLLDNSSYSWDLNSSGVIIHRLNLFVENAMFRENENGSGIFVTAAVLRSAFRDADVRKTTVVPNPATEGIVSLTLMSISACCLLITFFTYALFHVLRSQPGINNMILCLCLIFGYLVFMFGSNRINLDPGCKILGGVIHFTWIFAFFWMNVCSFHMYRVIGSLNNLTHSTNRLVVTLSYLLYSILGSAIVVGINIGVTYYISDGLSYGYGYEKTGLCYIYEPMMALYSMALPALCLVIVNIVMFGIVVARCRRVSNVQRHVQTDKNYFSIYVKLSTLTGMTWIVAVPMILSLSVVFNYIYIALTCTQGIYVMIAFTCNKRIFKLYSGRYDVKGATCFSIYGTRAVTRSKSLSTTTSESVNLKHKSTLNHI